MTAGVGCGVVAGRTPASVCGAALDCGGSGVAAVGSARSAAWTSRSTLTFGIAQPGGNQTRSTAGQCSRLDSTSAGSPSRSPTVRRRAQPGPSSSTASTNVPGARPTPTARSTLKSDRPHLLADGQAARPESTRRSGRDDGRPDGRHGSGRVRDSSTPGPGGRQVEIGPQVLDAPGRGLLRPQLFGIEGARRRSPAGAPGDRDVQSPLAAGLVQRAEVQRQHAALVRR